MKDIYLWQTFLPVLYEEKKLAQENIVGSKSRTLPQDVALSEGTCGRRCLVQMYTN